MPTHDTTDPWLRKVTALLAKAESTEFPEEAEAFLAKAQELMARHAIDEAMVAARSGRHQASIDSRRVVVEPPYASAKASMLGAIARANDCRMVIARTMHGRSVCTIVGYRSDLDNVLLLFASLSQQATAAMLRARPEDDGIRAFRRSFLLGFARRIGERLREAGATARDEATRTMGPSVAVAMRTRSSAVEQAFVAQFPWLQVRRIQVSSWSGMHSGRSAADAAALGGPAVHAPRALGR